MTSAEISAGTDLLASLGGAGLSRWRLRRSVERAFERAKGEAPVSRR